MYTLKEISIHLRMKKVVMNVNWQFVFKHYEVSWKSKKAKGEKMCTSPTTEVNLSHPAANEVNRRNITKRIDSVNFHESKHKGI